MGRPLQTNLVKASPTSRDILQPHTYDTYGREAKKYLPYTYYSNHGAIRSATMLEQATFYKTTNDKVADETRPFSEVLYDKLPSMESFGPGNSWHANSKKTITRFRINTATDNIRLWRIENGLPKSTSSYPAGSLTIEESFDEEGKGISIYREGTGRIVLQEVQNGSTWLKSWFVYDDYDGLRFIIPPIVAASHTPTQADADLWFYQYEYDNEHRETGSKSPDAGWVYTIYDKWDRPVLVQDANQRAKSPAEWSFVKYDDWSRPVISGTITSTATRANLTNNVAASANRYETKNTSSVGYTLNKTYPTNAAEANLLSISYYDDYSFRTNVGWDAEGFSYGFTKEPEIFGTAFTNVKGLPTGSKVKVLGERKWLNSITWYDNRYRPLQTIAEHHNGGVIRNTTQYGFTDQVEKNLLVNTLGNINILERFSYDHQGRLLKAYHKTSDNTISGPEVILYALEYNELGEVVDKKLYSKNGGSSYLQSIDYRYNIRGSPRSINNASLSVAHNNDDTNDLFGMELSYESVISGLGATPKYDGNISGAIWNSGKGQKGYRYNYDGLDRLQHARYHEKGTSWQLNDKYSEQNINYNSNGNITSLTRKDNAANVDVLTYSYNGNQLTTVRDAANATKGFKDGNTSGIDYEYDANGNLKKDRNLKISSITYNVLNKPEVVTFENRNKLIFRYDASGAKLWMEYRKGTAQTLAWKYYYLGGFLYKGNNLESIAHAQGRVVKQGNAFAYHYHLTDHLGNIRTTITSHSQSTKMQATASSFEAAAEDSLFMKLDETRTIVHPTINHTIDGSPEAVRLNAARGIKDGPATMVPVMPEIR